MFLRLLGSGVLMGAVLMAVGCNTGAAGGGGGGGGGGGNTGPDLSAYQLDGSNPELEADIAALTTAYNEALVCIGDDDVSFTDQQNLDALKASYTGTEDEFPAFVSESSQRIVDGADEICNYELGDDAALDALIAEITAQRNRGRECRGDDPSLTDENSLDFLKQGYLLQILSFEDMMDAAEALASDAALLADQECEGQQE